MNDYRLPVSAATAGAFAFNQRAIRLLLAGDDQNFLDGLRRKLDSEFEVVATARTSKEVMSCVEEHKPDVVLLGGWSPEHELISLRNMKALPRAPKVLVLADQEDKNLHAPALAAGADACLPKSQFQSQWRSLIRNLAMSA